MKKSRGFSVVSILMGMTLMGILGALAKPALDSLMARAAQAEVKTTLMEMKAVQTMHMHALSQDSATIYAFDEFGYSGGGTSLCGGSALDGADEFGWRPAACNSMRYSYEGFVRPVGYSGTGSAQTNIVNSYEIIARGKSDQTSRYVFAGCEGSGSSVYGESFGDVWRLRSGGKPELCRDVVLACNDQNPATGKCNESERLARFYPWKMSGAGSAGNDGAGEDYVIEPCSVVDGHLVGHANGTKYVCRKVWVYTTIAGTWNTGAALGLDPVPRGSPCTNVCNHVHSTRFNSGGTIRAGWATLWGERCATKYYPLVKKCMVFIGEPPHAERMKNRHTLTGSSWNQ